MNESLIKRGDVVRVRPEFLDPGEQAVDQIAIEDEDGGRVKVRTNFGWTIEGVQVIESRMLEKTGRRDSR